MNIPGVRQEIAILLAQAGVVAPFESGPSWALQAVIPLGVYAMDGAHGAAKIPVRGLKEEMVMMAHQAVPMNHQPQALMRGGEGIEKEVVVRIGVKDPLPPSPPLHHRIQRMVVFYADGSGPDDTFNDSISCNKLHDPYYKTPQASVATAKVKGQYSDSSASWWVETKRLYPSSNPGSPQSAS